MLKIIYYLEAIQFVFSFIQILGNILQKYKPGVSFRAFMDSNAQKFVKNSSSTVRVELLTDTWLTL